MRTAKPSSAADRNKIREFAGGLEAAGIAAVVWGWSPALSSSSKNETSTARAGRVRGRGRRPARSRTRSRGSATRRRRCWPAAASSRGRRRRRHLRRYRASFNSAETITCAATFALILILVAHLSQPHRGPASGGVDRDRLPARDLAGRAPSGKVCFDVNASLTSLLIIVLFGIGTDYILFLLSATGNGCGRATTRERRSLLRPACRPGRRKLRAGRDRRLPCAAAGVARFLRTLAPGLAIAVAVTLLACLTLIPAVVSLLGPYVFWPSKGWQRRPRALFKRLGRVSSASRPAGAASGGLLVARGRLPLLQGGLRLRPRFPRTPSPAGEREHQRRFAAGAPPRPRSTSPTPRLSSRASGRVATEPRATTASSRSARRSSPNAAPAPAPRQPDENAVSNAAIDLAAGRSATSLTPPRPGTRSRVGGATRLRRHPLRAGSGHARRLPDGGAADRAHSRSPVAEPRCAHLSPGAVVLSFVATLGAGVYLFQGLGTEPACSSYCR